MKAQIAPLKGKYYGTRIETDKGVIEFALEGEWGTPSDRERETWCTFEEFAEADVGGEGRLADTPENRRYYEGEMMCDGHWENALTYRVAQAIVAALEALPED